MIRIGAKLWAWMPVCGDEPGLAIGAYEQVVVVGLGTDGQRTQVRRLYAFDQSHRWVRNDDLGDDLVELQRRVRERRR